MRRRLFRRSRPWRRSSKSRWLAPIILLVNVTVTPLAPESEAARARGSTKCPPWLWEWLLRTATRARTPKAPPEQQNCKGDTGSYMRRCWRDEPGVQLGTREGIRAFSGWWRWQRRCTPRLFDVTTMDASGLNLDQTRSWGICANSCCQRPSGPSPSYTLTSRAHDGL